MWPGYELHADTLDCQSVLIYGAGGGVGTFAGQIAKWLGARVTAVTSTKNVDLMRSIGADHVLDYTREDFTRREERYDVLFDIGANRSYRLPAGPGSQRETGALRRARRARGRAVEAGHGAEVPDALR